MSAKSIQFELVSPERKLVDEPMNHVVIPGTKGYLGVGQGHASYVVSLGHGTVTLYETSLQDKNPKKIFIAGGFADISGERCTVLAEQAVNLDDLDAKDLTATLKDLKKDLKSADKGAEKILLQNKIDIIESQIEAIS